MFDVSEPSHVESLPLSDVETTSLLDLMLNSKDNLEFHESNSSSSKNHNDPLAVVMTSPGSCH